MKDFVVCQYKRQVGNSANNEIISRKYILSLLLLTCGRYVATTANFESRENWSLSESESEIMRSVHGLYCARSYAKAYRMLLTGPCWCSRITEQHTEESQLELSHLYYLQLHFVLFF